MNAKKALKRMPKELLIEPESSVWEPKGEKAAEPVRFGSRSGADREAEEAVAEAVTKVSGQARRKSAGT